MLSALTSSVAGIICFVSLCMALLISGIPVWCDTDDDTTLEFYWSPPATGDVHYYNVYLFIYDDSDAPGPNSEDDYALVDTTFKDFGSDAPKQDNLYILKGTIKDVVIEDGKGYKLKVAAVDSYGNIGPKSVASETTWCQLPASGSSLPETPVITIVCNQLGVSWKSSAESGIAEYKYAIGTTPGGMDAGNWTSVGTDTELNLTDLCLTPGETYYIAVIAKSVAGIQSSVGISDGITYCGDIAYCGDVNGDCSISRDDAELTLKIAAHLIKPTDYQKWAADMNGDGEVKSDDALFILRKADGLAAPDEYIVAASSDSYVNVVLPEIYGIAGETIKAPIKISETDTARSGDICIVYDSAVLQAVNVSAAPDTLIASNNTELGILRIAFAHVSKSSSSIMFEVQFTILADDVSSLTFKSIELYGNDGRSLYFIGRDGRFSSWAIPPERSALLQNFPNPFNPETWIPYQLREDSDVTIRIYSLSGNLVRGLPLGHKSAGLYVSRDRAAYWNGRNEAGEPVASGVYFAVLKAGDYQQIRLMGLLR